MKDGFGAPYIKAWFGSIELTHTVESFKYISSEDDDEECDISIRTDDVTTPDQPAYQEGAMWTILWGWIGGAKSHVRKIWLYDLKWDFDDSQITGTLGFNEKGKSTKQRDSKKVYKGPTGIIPVLQDVAKIHGLTPVVETTDSNGKPLVIYPDDVRNELNLYFGAMAFNDDPNFQVSAFQLDLGPVPPSLVPLEPPGLLGGDTAPVGDFKVDWEKLRARSLSTNADFAAFPNMTPGLIALVRNFGWGNDIAMGNKTDKQVLDELGRKQPSGLYITDSTDDELRIKQRNFGQAPHRSYSFKGGDGELISFQPESKQKSKNGSGVNLNYDGWDKDNKTYFNGSANVGNDVELSETAQKTLVKYQKELARLNATSTIHDEDVYGYVGHMVESPIAADATARTIIIRTPVTLLDKKNALQATIDTFTSNNKGFNDPTKDNPYDTFSHASNNRQDSELNMNPGYLEAMGDPTILKGMILTVVGVSKKYSGNYYTTRVEHHMGGDKKYVIHCDIVRQGHNIKTNDSYIDYKDSGKSINKEIGSDGSKPNTRTIPMYQNP